MIELRPFQSAAAILDAPLGRFMNTPCTRLAPTHQLFQGVAMERERDGINRVDVCPVLRASREHQRPPHAYKQHDTCDYGSKCHEHFDVYGPIILIGRL